MVTWVMEICDPDSYVCNQRKQLPLKEEFLAAYVKELTEHGFSIPNNPITPI